MAVYKDESEITMETGNLTDAHSAFRSYTGEDRTAVSGGKLYRCVAVSFCLLCVLQVSLNTSLRLAFSSGLDAYCKNLTEESDKLRSINFGIEESCKNLTEDGEDLRKKLSNFASQQSSWARERDELKRKLDDLGTRQNTLTGERNELKRKLNDFASQQRSWAREREELKRKLSDSASQQSSLTRERDKLQKKVNDFAVYLPQGWVFFGGSLYLTSSIKKTWQDSRDDCVHRGAKLMIINSYEEQEFARKNKKTMWIGLSDRATEGVWRWVDETPLITSFWGKGEPNNYEGRNEDCVAVNYHGDTNNWNDLECGSENFWICELKMDL